MSLSTDSSAVAFPASRDPDDDPRILAVLKEYQVEWEAGAHPNRTRYLSRHPELAAQLAVYLDSIDLLHRGAPGLSGPGTKRPLETGLARGDRLGEFELVREIGRGGMGVVYEARQAGLNRRVAVKVLPTSLAADRVRLQRFVVEAQAAAAVAHPNIVTVYAVGEDHGLHYYAMRLVDGDALDTVVPGAAGKGPGSRAETCLLPAVRSTDPAPPPSQSKSSPNPVPPSQTASSTAALESLARTDRPAYYRQVAALSAQVARALDHAHQCGVVHRDIKPANLLLDASGHIWVTDFGLAQLAEGPSVTQTGAAVGTLRYMSPEQASGDRRRLDHRTDVYSLAATLYELATGRPAFPAEEPAVLLHQIAYEEPAAPSSLAAAFPKALETVLLKALQKEPRDRYATSGEFADDLERFLEGRPILARQPSTWDRSSRWAGRHPAAMAATLVSLLVVVIASGIATALVARQQAETEQAYEQTHKAQLVATERARAEKLARDEADQLAKAERERADEAEKRFQRAKKLGDDILKITEEEIGAETPFQGPRRRLLLAALDNYRGLLADKHDDPNIRAELDKIAAHVQELLADQDLRREANAAFLMANPDVQAELSLSRDLVRRVDREFAGTRGGQGGQGRPWFPSQEKKMELIKALTKEQRQRLRQISLQFRGAIAFNEPEVVEALNLSSWQRHQIKSITAAGFGGFGQPPKKGGAGSPPGKKDSPSPGPDPKMETLNKILDLLTVEQQDAWRALCGKPFYPNH